MHSKSITTICVQRKQVRAKMEKITHIVFDHDGTLVGTTTMEPYLYDGITEILDFLSKRQVKLYVWTARSKDSTHAILTDLGIRSHFEAICGGHDAQSKPSPDGIEMLVSPANPQNVIVIGDSLGDIIGGVSFGAHSIGAMWGHGDPNAAIAYEQRGAKASFLKVEKLKDYLDKLI